MRLAPLVDLPVPRDGEGMKKNPLEIVIATVLSFFCVKNVAPWIVGVCP
jgi:hypothetical protein